MARVRSPEETAVAIAGMARVLNREGEIERAAELLAFVANWPATPYTIWSAVAKTLREVETQLPPDLFAAASDTWAGAAGGRCRRRAGRSTGSKARLRPVAASHLRGRTPTTSGWLRIICFQECSAAGCD